MTDFNLKAANDNPGGETEIRLALVWLAQLLAKAEAKRRAGGPFVVAVGHDAPANSNQTPENDTPEKGKVK